MVTDLHDQEYDGERHEQHEEDGRAVGDEDDGSDDEGHVKQPQVHVHRHVHVYVVHVLGKPVQYATLKQTLIRTPDPAALFY